MKRRALCVVCVVVLAVRMVYWVFRPGQRVAVLIPEDVQPSKCHWVDMKYNWLLSAKPSMCIRDGSDILSAVIHRERKWPDCDDLLDIMLNVVPKPIDGIFIDVGANIGSCTVLIAGHRFQTHAFEPQPDNLFYLKATLANNEELRSWVTVHEVGLGDHEHGSVIYRQEGNAGNSVVGLVHPDDPANVSDRLMMGKNRANVTIQVLDDVLWPDAHRPAPRIALMKIDVQGYEVKVLKGARRLLSARSIQAIKTELAPAHLGAHGSAPAHLCAMLHDAGFSLFAKLRGAPLSIRRCALHRGELYALLH
jgi:FkbM family methyltransferase